MNRFSSENILVVGACSEIGTAIAHGLVREGARVTLSGRSRGALEQLQRLIGDQASIAVCDLSDETARGKLLADSAAVTGKFSGMVYVAGFHRLMPLGPGYGASLTQHLAINVHAPLDLIKDFSSRHNSDDTRQRSVTVIASIAHLLGEPALSAYSASKGAMVSAVRALAVEFARKNIRINSLSPGWVMGDSADRVAGKIPVGTHEKIVSTYPLGFGVPTDVAEAVMYLASPGARWVTGIDLVIDGGRTCV